MMLVAGMGAFLVCALAIPSAFEQAGVVFGVGYLLVVVVYSVMFATVAGRAVLQFAPINLLAAMIVIVAGLVDGILAYSLFAAVIAIHTVPPWLSRRSTQLQIHAAHFVERHGLLLIVASGSR